MPKKLKISWFVGIPKEYHESHEKDIRHFLSLPSADKLVEILRSKLKDKDVPEYDSPSWAYKQAHYNGRAEAIKEVLELIETKQDNE